MKIIYKLIFKDNLGEWVKLIVKYVIFDIISSEALENGPWFFVFSVSFLTR